MNIEYVSIRDETSFDRGGTVSTFKRYEFFIGKHGPFVERIPADAPPGEIERRVQALHAQLSALPTTL